MSYSMRLFAVPYRVTVCVLPVLMYIAVYLSVCVLVTCLCEQLFSYCVFMAVFVHLLTSVCAYSIAPTFIFSSSSTRQEINCHRFVNG